jgi:predicted alpha/beta hydrolase
MHPADRLALVVSAFFITGVGALWCGAWGVFENRWLNAILALAGAVAFFVVGWLTHRWSILGDDPEGPT